MLKVDSLRDHWASLGVAFAYGRSIQVDPETAIIGLVNSKEFPQDKKMMSIALAWLKEYSSLVHVERFKAPMEDLSPEALAVLGAIAKKCVKFGDHRWKSVEKWTRQRSVQKNLSLSDSEHFIKRHGLDSDFLTFGIRVTPLAPEDSKKLLSRERTIQSNSWLRNRLLFGTNLRADVATVQSLKLADTAYAAAKLLGCSLNAAYRNWNALKEAGWPR